MAVSPKTQKSAARLDFRLNPRVKSVIEQAAAVSGQTVSEFAVSALYRTAREVLEKEQSTRLSDRDRDIFLAALDSDAKPNEALKRAARKYKRRA
ncbi:MAG TPA: DUF1778 domain-containing protein [Blastocatellia bacterium]|nr:DUF1778 domain-containing protein [Blastocatellia bacterium]